MKLYHIKWGAQDEEGVWFTFTTAEARDATWDAIQRIPWSVGHGRKHRDVVIGGNVLRESPDCDGMLGEFSRCETEVYDVPMLVSDALDVSR